MMAQVLRSLPLIWEYPSPGHYSIKPANGVGRLVGLSLKSIVSINELMTPNLW